MINKKSPDGPVPQQSGVLAMVYGLSKFANDRCGRILGDPSWTARQVQLLNAISHNQGCSQLSLALRTGIDSSTISEMVTRLARRGLTLRRRSRHDASVDAIWLTPDGREFLEASERIVARLEGNLLRSLSIDERCQFVDLLNRVVSETRSNHSGRTGTYSPMSQKLDFPEAIDLE